MENATLMEEYGYVKDDKVFLKGYLEYPDRQIGEVKRTEQEAIDYFKNRFTIAQNKVAQLEQEIEEAQNKGSYLTKLVQLRKKLIGFDAIGNFIPLLERLDQTEHELNLLIHTNQEKNLEIKRALIEDAKAAAAIPDWNEATDAIQEIKSKWIRTGPVDRLYQEEIDSTFQEILDNYFQRRRDFFAEQNRVIEERINECERIIKMTKQLSWSDDLDGSYIKAREIRNLWNNVGEIPAKKFFKLTKSYKHFLKLFYDKYNNAKGIQPKVRVDPRILEQQKLLVRAEELLKEKDVLAAAEQTKALLSQWREIKIPFKLADKELSERFRTVCDRIFELSYLYRVIGRKYPAFDMKSREEQLLTLIREMEWLVKRERSDLEFAIEQMDSQAVTLTPDELKATQGRVNIQKRKVNMKDIILRDFRRQLENLS